MHSNKVDRQGRDRREAAGGNKGGFPSLLPPTMDAPSGQRDADSPPSPCFLGHSSVDSAVAAATSEGGSSVFQECWETFPSAPAIDVTSSHCDSGGGTRQCNSKTVTHSSNLNLIQIDTSPRDDVVSHFSQSRTLLVVYFDAQSCQNKASELNDLVTDLDIDILLLTETWLKAVSYTHLRAHETGV